MPYPAPRCFVVQALAMLSVAGAVMLVAPAETSAQSRGQLYALVLDQSGQPVVDLTADDFALAIDGTDLSIVSANLDAEPLKVALMVDNGDSLAQANAETMLREALGAFVTTLAPQHEVGVFTIARNVQRRVDFTSDRDDLLKATGEIFTDRGAGARMMDGLFETWERRFEPEDSWPVFVMVLTDGGELSGYISDDEYAEFVNDLLSRGATIHIVLFSRQGANSQTGATQIQYGLNLTQNTGGQFERIAAATGLTHVLTEFATHMNDHFEQVSRRYRIVYEVPEDVTGGGISVSVARPNVSLQLFADRRLPE